MRAARGEDAHGHAHAASGDTNGGEDADGQHESGEERRGGDSDTRLFPSGCAVAEDATQWFHTSDHHMRASHVSPHLTLAVCAMFLCPSCACDYDCACAVYYMALLGICRVLAAASCACLLLSSASSICAFGSPPLWMAENT